MSGFGLVEITLQAIGGSKPDDGGGAAGGFDLPGFTPSGPVFPAFDFPNPTPIDDSGPTAPGEQVGVSSITPEVADAIREIGGEPMRYNRVEWPIGASRHMVGRFIVHGPVAQLILSGSTAQPMVLRFGDIAFAPVFARNPVPLLISGATGPVYAIEVVDERFHWQKVGSAKDGFNLSEPSKEPGDDDQTPRDAIEHLFGELGVDPSLYELPEPGDTDPLGDSLDLRDVVGSSLPAAALLDKILTATGHVLAAYPSTEYFQANGKKYRVIAIEDGEATAHDELKFWSNAIIAGGIHSPSGAFIELSDGAAKHTAGPVHWLDVEVPSSVIVHFPLIVKGGGFEDKRFYPIESNAGMPVGVEAHPVKAHVQDVAWARRIPLPDDQPPGDPDPGADIENFEELEERAAKVARRYYARFKAGAGEWLLKGLREVDVYAGAQSLIWHLTLTDVTTRVRGTIDDPLLGFRIDTALAARDVFSTGGVRAFARPDGSMLIDGGVLDDEIWVVKSSAARPEYANQWVYVIEEADTEEGLDGLPDIIAKENGDVIEDVLSIMKNTAAKYNNGNDTEFDGYTVTVGPIPDGTPVKIIRALGYVWIDTPIPVTGGQCA